MIVDVSKSPKHHNSHHLHDNFGFSLQPSGFFAVYDVIFVLKVQIQWKVSGSIALWLDMMIMMMKTYSNNSASSVPSGFN